MNRITAIELHNFLAFYGTDNKISLPNGENLLVYGENGSGKSSLCRALEIFFDSKKHPQFADNQRNIWATQTDPPTDLHLTFHEITPSQLPSQPNIPQTLNMTQASGAAWIEDSRLASGFLTYRDILKTHFLEEYRQNLFDLVVNEILRGVKNSKSGKLLNGEWQEIEEDIESFLSKGKEDFERVEYDESGEQVSLDDIIDNILSDFNIKSDEFDNAFEAILQQLNPLINQFLSFFEQNISVELYIEEHLDKLGNTIKGTMISFRNFETDIDLLKKLRTDLIDLNAQQGVNSMLQNLVLKKPLLTAKVTYFGQFIQEHQTFLNEARLSALAICIFLAALRKRPDPPIGCKVLFLDDVLIGLDSGNRLPLFKILEQHFGDFQIILSTYDRHWFELSKDGLPKEKWISTELFAKTEFDIAGHAIREVPRLFPTKGNVEIARAYFEHFDYPAAGNTLRKECERILKNYMEDAYLISSNGNLLGLGDLLLKLTEYFEDAGQTIPRDTLSQIIFFKNALFNPSSHHDLRSSFYRKEIEKAFDAIENLQKLPKITWLPILHPCQEFKFDHAGSNFEAKVLVGDYVYKTSFNGNYSISKMRFYIDWWKTNNIEFYDPKLAIRYSDVEIARITTKPHSLETLSSWLERRIKTQISDVKKELNFSGNSLEKILS
jgi:energy-coupling factor transporter ATP-binding protein EcfA2